MAETPLAAKIATLPGERAEGSSKKIAYAALHHRDFRFYFVGTMLAMMADNIEHVISYWLLYQKFHSPVLAGFAVIRQNGLISACSSSFRSSPRTAFA